MDKRLINSRKTTNIVFIYATTMHWCSFPLYKSINPSRTMSRPHHDPRFLLRAEARGAVAAGTSPHPQGRQAVTAHAHWVRF